MTDYNPNSDYSTKEAQQELIISACNKAKSIFHEHKNNIPNEIKATMNIRMRSAMGRAFPNKGKPYIELNSRLFERASNQARWDTILHEVAHCLCFIIYPNKKIGHGHLWKQMCRNIGLRKPSRTHNVSTDGISRKRKKYEYTCDCTGKLHLVGATRHKRSITGQKRYSCRLCNGILKLNTICGSGVIHLNTLAEAFNHEDK